MQKEIHPVKYRKAAILPRVKLFNRVKWLLKEKYHNKPTRQFAKDIQRLKNGEPRDYVIGFVEFLGCKINLSKKPLIPRPETEYWMQKAIDTVSLNLNGRPNFEVKILDIFSGSGCSGVSVMLHVKNTKVVFVDKGKKCIDQIKINCALNKINKKRYKIITSDVFSNVTGKYDYIFANLPYIAKTSQKKIQKSVLLYEPKMALFGGEDGLFYIRKFLKKACGHLVSGGKIYMEFDSIQKFAIEKLINAYQYKNFTFYKDQYNKYRWVVISN